MTLGMVIKRERGSANLCVWLAKVLSNSTLSWKIKRKSEVHVPLLYNSNTCVHKHIYIHIYINIYKYICTYWDIFIPFRFHTRKPICILLLSCKSCRLFGPFVNSHKKVLILEDFQVSFIDPIVKFGIELTQMKQVLAYLWYYHKFMGVLL